MSSRLWLPLLVLPVLVARGVDAPKGAGEAERGAEGAAGKAGTEITCSIEASFDEKARKAVFVGDVQVKDAEFTLHADKLTAFLRREAVRTEEGAGDGGGEPAKGAKGAKVDAAGAAAGERVGGDADPGGEKGGAGAGDKGAKGGRGTGAIERAIAEGNVVFVRMVKGDNKEESRATGKAARAEFDGDTGDVVLSGWPQVQQGINNHIAAEESTVMIINQDGRMQTRGRSRTVIREETGEGGRMP